MHGSSVATNENMASSEQFAHFWKSGWRCRNSSPTRHLVDPCHKAFLPGTPREDRGDPPLREQSHDLSIVLLRPPFVTPTLARAGVDSNPGFAPESSQEFLH